MDSKRKTIKELLQLYKLTGILPWKAGRRIDMEEAYKERMKDVARENYAAWGYASPEEAWLDQVNNPTYDYRGYYSDPEFQNANSDAQSHWPDRYKTPAHRTFSDESKYHGVVSDKNPYGLRGGMWVGDKFIPAAWQSHLFPEYRGGKDDELPTDAILRRQVPLELQQPTPEQIATARDVANQLALLMVLLKNLTYVEPAQDVPKQLQEYYADKEDTRRFMERKRRGEELGDKIFGTAFDVATLYFPAAKLAFGAAKQVGKGIVGAAARGVKNAVETLRYGALGKPRIPKDYSPLYSDYNYYHGGLDADFDFSTLDVFRRGSKQAKKGKDYAGFYMFNGMQKPAAFKYGGDEAHGIKIADGAKILRLNSNIERIPRDELINYRNQGYDLITGPNVFGEPEYVLVNRDAIQGTHFFSESPKNEIYLHRAPKDIFKIRQPSAINWQDAQEVAITPRGLLSDEPLIARGIPKITAENAATITPRFAQQFHQFPQEVENILTNQIVPRRLRILKRNQSTNGAQKIEDFVKHNGEVDFSAASGLKTAKEQGWTFEEVQDYMQYKDYLSTLNETLSNGYIQYPRDAWNARHPAPDKNTLITGVYDRTTDKIELPEGFNAWDAAHEARHRMLMKAPTIHTEENILHNAYDYNLRDTEFGKRIYEKELETVNLELREALLRENKAGSMSLNTQDALLGSGAWYSDDHILHTLLRTNSYGKHIVENINKRIEQIKKSILNKGLIPGTKEFNDEVSAVKHNIVENIRYALQAVGVVAAAVKLNNK